LVPAPVLVELDHFVAPRAFLAFLKDVRRGAFVVDGLQPRDYVRLGELLATYTDLRLGFVDAAVLAVTERVGERRVATLDHRHFRGRPPRPHEPSRATPSGGVARRR
jgi:predicted nucleic acid-binding protein